MNVGVNSTFLAATLLTGAQGPDAINWNGPTSDVEHNAKLGCIHPAPFGRQCTAHNREALVACLRAQPMCRALTCPSPEVYQRGGRRDGITGAICQLRSVALQRWSAGEARARRHGMCTGPNGIWNPQQGCRNYFLSPVRILMPGQKRRPPPKFELVLVAPTDRGLADWLGLPREVSSTLSAGAVEIPDGLLGKGGAPITTTYHLYAVDKLDAKHAFDLKGIQHAGEQEKPRKPKWMDWRRSRRTRR